TGHGHLGKGRHFNGRSLPWVWPRHGWGGFCKKTSILCDVLICPGNTMQIIEVVSPASLEDDVLRLAKRNEVSDVWISGQRDNQSVIKILLSNEKSQKVMDQ